MESVEIPEILPQSNKQLQEERKERVQQMHEMIDEGSDLVEQSEAIRLHNIIKMQNLTDLSSSGDAN